MHGGDDSHAVKHHFRKTDLLLVKRGSNLIFHLGLQYENTGRPREIPASGPAHVGSPVLPISRLLFDRQLGYNYSTVFRSYLRNPTAIAMRIE